MNILIISQIQNVFKPTFLELDQFKTGQITKLMFTKKALSLQRVGIALFTCHKMDYVTDQILICNPFDYRTKEKLKMNN